MEFFIVCYKGVVTVLLLAAPGTTHCVASHIRLTSGSHHGERDQTGARGDKSSFFFKKGKNDLIHEECNST